MSGFMGTVPRLDRTSWGESHFAILLSRWGRDGISGKACWVLPLEYMHGLWDSVSRCDRSVVLIVRLCLKTNTLLPPRFNLLM